MTITCSVIGIIGVDSSARTPITLKPGEFSQGGGEAGRKKKNEFLPLAVSRSPPPRLPVKFLLFLVISTRLSL
ncbi:hypothetical protein ACMHYB_33715 [Sorangium sp. So ce1128]